MEDYYRRRAEEYEAIYYRDDPIQQNEQRKISDALMKALKNRDVLEIACGTGYWTHLLSQTARSIVATDIVEEMLKIARRKQYHCPVSFRREDAYDPNFADGLFDGGLANFWFSHIPKAKIDSFLNRFHRVLKEGAIVFIADNAYVSGIGGKLVTRNGDENTYKLRQSSDGREDLVLKNYYTGDQLKTIFSRYSENFRHENIFYGNRYWYVIYTLK